MTIGYRICNSSIALRVFTVKQKFLPGQIIRHKQTGQPLYVLHVYRIATIVIDPQEKGIVFPRVLLERDYPNYAKDDDMDKKGDSWEYHPVTMN